MLLGAIGSQFGGTAPGGTASYLIGCLGLALAAREWGWIVFPLPERKRQTEKFWVHKFGYVMASAMWGIHIGLGFATRITYGGFWLLVAVALALGDPLYGATLMLVYWLGRALPVWVAPVLIGADSDDVTNLPETVLDHRRVYHRVVGLALVWSTVVTILLLLPKQQARLLSFFSGLSL